jgi:phage shock protein PspC (stress-responsive transcriptional regulator)
MKKTVKINIAGIAFQIDEDAYERLKKYLDAIGKRFGHSNEGKEILTDVETRIAELFLARTSNQKEVISISDVEEVIGIMGKPEDYTDTEATEEEKAEHFAGAASDMHYSRRYNRRLYRDPDDAVLGGICGGLGSYFNIDPVIFRVLFVIFFFAGGIAGLIYLVLWIILPPARTAAQKLEMRGERVTIENIERSVKEEYEAVKNNMSGYGKSAYRGAHNAFEEMFHIIGVIIRGIAKAVLVIIGLVFIITGFALLIAFLSALILHQPVMSEIFSDSNVNLTELAGLVFSSSHYTIILICTLMVIGIPLIGLIYGGIKLLFRFQAKDLVPGLLLFVTWILSGVLLASLLTIDLKDFSNEANTETSTDLKPVKSKTLIIDVAPGKLDSLKKISRYVEKHEFGLYFNEAQHVYYGKPFLKIQHSEKPEASLLLTREAQGEDHHDARAYAEGIRYAYVQTDSSLIFDPVFEAPRGKEWRAPRLTLGLSIPEGMKIRLSRRAVEILHHIDDYEWNTDWEGWDNRWLEIPDKTFVMTDGGLKEVE